VNGVSRAGIAPCGVLWSGRVSGPCPRRTHARGEAHAGEAESYGAESGSAPENVPDPKPSFTGIEQEPKHPPLIAEDYRTGAEQLPQTRYLQ